jgi:hypothetical protein
VLQVQHAQETQLLQGLLDAVLAQQDRISRRHLEIAHSQKQAAVAQLRGQLENKRMKFDEDDSWATATTREDASAPSRDRAFPEAGSGREASRATREQTDEV